MVGPNVAEVDVIIDGDARPLRVTVRREAERAGREAGEAFGDNFDDEVDSAATRVGIRLRNTMAQAGRDSGRGFQRSFIGRLRGARNDFVNIVGVIGGFMERAFGSAVGGVIRGIGSAIGDLGSRLISLGGPLTNAGAGLATIGGFVQRLGAGGIDGLAIQVLTLAGAFGIAVASAGPLAAGLSTLSFNTLVLANTLAGGILGLLGTMGPMLLALGAGAGVAALAIGNMSKATERAFKPLGELFGRLGEIAERQLFGGIRDQISDLAESLEGTLIPLVRNTAQALRGFFDDLIASLQGPAFAQQMQLLSGILPVLLRQLLDIVAGLSSGLTNLFIAASPAARQLLEWINQLVQRFAAWTASAEGQQQLTNFFLEAVNIVRILSGLVGGVLGILRTLWQESSAQGAAFLENLRSIVAEFSAWLASREGRAQLRSFLNQAVSIGESLGQTIAEVGRLFDALDSPGTRAAFDFILSGINLFIATLTNLIRVIVTVGDTFRGVFRAAREAANFLRTNLNNLGDSIVQIIHRGLAPLRASFGAFARNARAAIQSVQDRINSAGGTLESLRRAAGRVGSFISNAFDDVRFSVQATISWFNNLINAIWDAIGAISQISFPSPPSWLFGGFPQFASGGIVTGPTRALVGEAGPEAIVPLNRPLSQVDPSVRALSALLQGQSNQALFSGGGNTFATGAIQVVTPYADPRLVAIETMDALAARGR